MSERSLMSWRDRRPLHQFRDAQVCNAGTALGTGRRSPIIVALGKSEMVDLVDDSTASILHRYRWRTSEALAKHRTGARMEQTIFEIAKILRELWCGSASADGVGELNGGGCPRRWNGEEEMH